MARTGAERYELSKSMAPCLSLRDELGALFDSQCWKAWDGVTGTAGIHKAVEMAAMSQLTFAGRALIDRQDHSICVLHSTLATLRQEASNTPVFERNQLSFLKFIRGISCRAQARCMFNATILFPFFVLHRSAHEGPCPDQPLYVDNGILRRLW